MSCSFLRRRFERAPVASRRGAAPHRLSISFTLTSRGFPFGPRVTVRRTVAPMPADSNASSRSCVLLIALPSTATMKSPQARRRPVRVTDGPTRPPGSSEDAGFELRPEVFGCLASQVAHPVSEAALTRGAR